MAPQSPRIIYGAGGLDPAHGFDDQKVSELLDFLEKEQIKALDTATIYGASETLLGNANAASRFTVDTKYPGAFAPTVSTKDTIVQTGKDSLKKLKTDSVEVYYFHSPDPRASLEDMLAGIQELYSLGAFKKFGLSNFSAKDVEEVVRICKENKYVVPSVYQGNYNAFAQKAETELLPTLRKHNIAYYVYSPIAGGFLAKTSDQLRKGGEGRWSDDTMVGRLYRTLYGTEKGFEGLDRWNELAKEHAIPNAELAYRWVAYHSAVRPDLGDAIIIGGRNIDQIKATLDGLKKGPLAKEVVDKIEEIWKLVESAAPLDNYHDYFGAGKMELPK